jgi:hypothetical protein
VATFSVEGNGSADLSFASSVAASSLRNAGISIELVGGVKTPDAPMIMLMAT